MTELLAAFVGIVLGAVAAGLLTWFLLAGKQRRLEDTVLTLREKRGEAEARVDLLEDRVDRADAEVNRARLEVRQYERQWTAAKAQLAEAQTSVAQQKALVEQAKATMSTTFRSLAADALNRNNEGFLTLAEQKFKALKTEAGHDLDVRKDAISALVRPVAETLRTYQQATTQLEERRQKEMGSIGEQLRAVAATQSQLHTETTRLVGALKSPQVRGRWGEIALRKTAELAGMAAYCDFCEQEGTDDGSRRPDMIVKLPNGRHVIVDSKVPLGGFIDALEAVTDDLRHSALVKHAKQVAGHIDRLSGKEYWKQFRSSPEFVVLFIPNDSFLAAAAERDPDLVENGLNKKIVLATPSTFIALLRAIEFGWRQQVAVDNAEEIRNLGQELSDRFSVLVEHLSKIGSSLVKAVESYNGAVASFESRVLPQARRFRALGAVGRKVVEELQPISLRPRTVGDLDGDDAPATRLEPE